MKDKSTKKKKWIAAVILVTVAIVCACLIAYFIKDKGDAREVVQEYVQAVNQQDFDLLVQCFPPDMQQGIRDNASKLGGSTVIFDNIHKDIASGDLGDNIILALSDLTTEKKEIIDGKYNGVDVASMNITDVSTVTYTLTTKGSKKEFSEKAQAVCGKIQGEWYILTTTSLADETATPTDIK